MFNWLKLGQVFDPRAFPDRPWLMEFAQGPASLVFENFVRVYFSCRPAPDSNGNYVSNSAWVDLDRLNLRKIIRVADSPMLRRGSCGEFDEFGIYPVSPIRHAAKILLYYGGWTRCESVPFNVAIGLATSQNNGATFEKYGRGPILSYSPHEPFILSGPKIRRFNERFYLFYIAGKKWVIENERPEPVYKIRMAISDNGVDWTKHGHDLIPDVLGIEEAQASPDVFFSDGKYHMFFCYRHGRNYRNSERGYRIGYAHSTDLLRWIRNDDQAGLIPSKDGWDAEMVSYPHVLQMDGRTFMFYLGNSVGRWGFGVAQLESE
jgi:hypothetical protein